MPDAAELCRSPRVSQDTGCSSQANSRDHGASGGKSEARDWLPQRGKAKLERIVSQVGTRETKRTFLRSIAVKLHTICEEYSVPTKAQLALLC